MRIDGKQIAEKIYKDLKVRVNKLKYNNIIPHLAVILVGANPASVAYVTLKQKKGEEIGAEITVLKYPETVTTNELIEKVKLLNIDPSTNGILIQRPLPSQIDVEKLELLTDPKKDVDGFHPDSPYILPLPLAVVRILEEVYKMQPKRGVARGEGLPSSARNEVRTSDGRGARQDPVRAEFQTWLESQNIVVIGKGSTGGGPIIKLLKKLGADPTIIDSKTENPKGLMKKADIIVASVGRENVVEPENVKKGAILIGVGILRGSDGKLKGDYDEEKIKGIAGFYTPTPGGVGPVNVAMLMENLVTAAEKQTS